MTSIRHFLMVSLLVSMAIVTITTGIWTYRSIRDDVDHLLDAELVEASRILQILLESDYSEKELKQIQSALLTLPAKSRIIKEFPGLKDEPDAIKYIIHRVFQVWSQDGTLLIRSQNAPAFPLAQKKTGFTTNLIEDTYWRVYTLNDEAHNLRFQVAQRSDIRGQLAETIGRDHMTHFFIMMPIILILIWGIVGYGLRHLQIAAKQMDERDKNKLDPVTLDKVPIEIQPLINAINQLFKRLHNAFEREKRFTGDAAHELRTPLAALKAQSQVAIRIKDENERVETLKTIIDCVDRCNHVVDQLLILSRLRPQEPVNNPKTVNISAVAGMIIADLANMAVSKNIDISLNAAEKPANITANETSIAILFRNLIDNAIRYTPENGEVTVTTQLKNQKVIFTVTDTGPGIPQEKRQRVFERFYRELGTKATGSGLGLSIVRQIVTLHHADINLFTPENGKGLGINIIFKAVV